MVIDALEPVCSALGGGVGGTTSQMPPSPTRGMSTGMSPSPAGGEGREHTRSCGLNINLSTNKENIN